MENEIDTEAGGEPQSLSIEEAANAYAKANPEEAPEGQSEAEEPEHGEQPEDELEDGEQPDESEDDGEEEPEDDEGQAEDDDGEEPETDRGRFVAANGKVRLPDGSVQTVADLVQGNLRDRDYRQKTMGLSDEKRQFEEQSSALKASQQEVEQQREYVQQLMGAFAPQPPDPSMLDDNSPNFDPIGYNQQDAMFRNAQQHLQALQQQSQTVKQQTEAEQQKQRKERVGKEWEALQQAMPELRNRDKLEAFDKELQSAAQTFGFSQKEIAETLPLDHRFTLVLRDANKWRKLQASKPKAREKVQGKPPVQRGSKRLTPGVQKARKSNDAMKRLKQSGTVEDAAAAYLASQKG